MSKTRVLFQERLVCSPFPGQRASRQLQWVEQSSRQNSQGSKLQNDGFRTRPFSHL